MFVVLQRSYCAFNCESISFKTEAEVSTTCDDTKHIKQKAVWSPGYFTAGVYPDGSVCEWRLKAKIGYRLILRHAIKRL